MRVRAARARGATSSATSSSAGSSKPAQAPSLTSVSVARGGHLAVRRAPATGPFERQLLETEVGVRALLGGHLRPSTVAGRHGLDPPIEVAGHEGGRADEEAPVAPLAEGQDAGVLEVAPDDRPDP